ncbi:hypothetical protein [Nitrincola alkalisediminis]|uniref:hypothetical protein n=1 Tax=Nitrincola alkalisediminis TaxID=1366656 RepID=UPI001FEAE240|nr:hypothetical protein [Nitrincola alkalisediminis]
MNGQSGISPEMALRLSKALCRTLENWLAMQNSYHLWHLDKKLSLDKVQKVELVRWVQAHLTFASA